MSGIIMQGLCDRCGQWSRLEDGTSWLGRETHRWPNDAGCPQCGQRSGIVNMREVLFGDPAPEKRTRRPTIEMNLNRSLEPQILESGEIERAEALQISDYSPQPTRRPAPPGAVIRTIEVQRIAYGSNPEVIAFAWDQVSQTLWVGVGKRTRSTSIALWRVLTAIDAGAIQESEAMQVFTDLVDRAAG